MPQIHTAYILLGSNMGRRKSFLQKASKHIRKRVGIITRSSSIYQTAAWGKTNQPEFLNQVLEVNTESTASACLHLLLKIESEMGRVRSEKNAPRTIDLDILYFDGLILNTPSLTIPHPFILERRFVLTPLQEISPDYLHPVYQKSNTALLEQCSDPLNVKKL